jgi:hypothetical protein
MYPNTKSTTMVVEAVVWLTNTFVDALLAELMTGIRGSPVASDKSLK